MQSGLASRVFLKSPSTTCSYEAKSWAAERLRRTCGDRGIIEGVGVIMHRGARVICVNHRRLGQHLCHDEETRADEACRYGEVTAI